MIRRRWIIRRAAVVTVTAAFGVKTANGGAIPVTANFIAVKLVCDAV